MQMGRDVLFQIDIDKSVSHQQSHNEIGGANPCCRRGDIVVVTVFFPRRSTIEPAIGWRKLTLTRSQILAERQASVAPGELTRFFISISALTEVHSLGESPGNFRRN